MPVCQILYLIPLIPDDDVDKRRHVPEPFLDEDVGSSLSGEHSGQLCPAEAPRQGQEPRHQPDQQAQAPGAHRQEDRVSRDEDS